MPNPGAETRQCPEEFQERLTQMFGVNQFGDPHFKIVWGQSQFIRLGNRWLDRDGVWRTEYRDTYQCSGNPGWVIMRWKAPFEYGTPESYYGSTYDFDTDLFMVGEYPWRGRYEVLQSLNCKEVIDGKLVIDYFPLSHYMIDQIIPMMLAFQALSQEQKDVARQAAKEAQDKKDTEDIAEMMAENLPRFWGPTSYSNQGCHTALLDKKMHEIQQVWNRQARMLSGRSPQYARGMSAGSRPRIISSLRPSTK
jgi:hypothetical protein